MTANDTVARNGHEPDGTNRYDLTIRYRTGDSEQGTAVLGPDEVTVTVTVGEGPSMLVLSVDRDWWDSVDPDELRADEPEIDHTDEPDVAPKMRAAIRRGLDA